MPEITTFVDEKLARQLSRSAAIRDVLTDQAAIVALIGFLEEAEIGLEPTIEASDPEADRLIRAIIEPETDERVAALINGTEFTPDDVLASAVKHMIANDMQVIGIESALEVAQVEDERQALLNYLRDVDDQ